MPPPRNWNDHEIRVLKKEYPILGPGPLARRFGRTRSAVQNMAIKLGVILHNAKGRALATHLRSTNIGLHQTLITDMCKKTVEEIEKATS